MDPDLLKKIQYEIICCYRLQWNQSIFLRQFSFRKHGIWATWLSDASQHRFHLSFECHEPYLTGHKIHLLFLNIPHVITSPEPCNPNWGALFTSKSWSEDRSLGFCVKCWLASTNTFGAPQLPQSSSPQLLPLPDLGRNISNPLEAFIFAHLHHLPGTSTNWSHAASTDHPTDAP